MGAEAFKNRNTFCCRACNGRPRTTQKTIKQVKSSFRQITLGIRVTYGWMEITFKAVYQFLRMFSFFLDKKLHNHNFLVKEDQKRGPKFAYHCPIKGHNRKNGYQNYLIWWMHFSNQYVHRRTKCEKLRCWTSGWPELLGGVHCSCNDQVYSSRKRLRALSRMRMLVARCI